MNSIQCQSTSFSSHVLLLACINNVNLSTIDLHMHQIVSFRSLTFKFSSPYGCEWPKPHSNKHVPYPKKIPPTTHTRLETIPKKLLTPFHLKKHRKAFLLGKKITKRQNGTVSVNGIIHGSSLDRWHLMTQVLASLPPARSQVKKVGSCGSLAHQTISKGLPSLQRKNSSPLKSGDWETTFYFWSLPIFRCYVSVRGG